MKLFQTKHLAVLSAAIGVLMVAGCSSQKNTSQTRWWKSFNAKYNTYYNGAQAYIDGSLEKEKGNKDNYTEIIPLYPVGNKQSRELGSGNYDRAIEKAQKVIQRYSIKKKPEWNKGRKKTERDIEWLSRREYNPFMWKAWMLMGRSQFHKGAFDEAAATFSYMSRLYQTQPAIYGKARAWLAKCYIEEDWMYDAEDIIRNMQRDSLDWRAVKEWDYTYADYYIHAGDYEKAIGYLRKVIKHEMRRKQKAREWFLLGQLQAAVGNKEEAYKAFKHVVRQNPPYELEFNAHIAMTEVMATGHSRQMISRLKRMAASDNNKDYLDQVYYAMGNIYLAEKDTLKAISAYEKGNEKATRNGIEKGVLLLHLGDLYWALEKYSDAKRCYGEAIGLLDKDRDDYEELSNRSLILDELVPYTEAVHLQDSLQALALMPEEERNAAIDRVIEALKKKEKEERRQQAEAEAAQQQSQQGGMNVNVNNVGSNSATASAQPGGQQGGLWYFYNPMAVSQGKETFRKQWGKRENADDWQRVNKTVVGGIGSADDEEELTDEQRDSIAQAEAVSDSLSQVVDSAQNDPHKRAYYLAQIPFTEEQLEASNKILENGLHHAGVIFKDRLDNLQLSEKHLRRVADDYPDYEEMADVYYHLFLLYSRRGRPDIADSYVAKLQEEYPDNQWTVMLTDPNFAENSKFGVHIEDSLYAATYEAFKQGRYQEVGGNVYVSENRFPLGANRDKFLFIGGLAKLNNGDANGCVADMKTVVEKYPQSRISEMAGMIVNGVNAGKRLHGGKFNIEDIWDRRTSVLNDSDSIQARKFTAERLTDFKFMIVYHPDSVNENKLLFELAKFNFTNFLVRNFEITVEDLEGLHQMQVSGFRSYDEAYQYARELNERRQVAELLSKKTKVILISESNLELIGTQFSYKDYDDFYARHFAPLQVTHRYLLSEPAEVATPRERDLEEEIQSKALTPDDMDAIQEEGLPNGTAVEESYPAEEEQQAPEQPQDTYDIQDHNTPTGQPAAEDVYTLPEENTVAPEPEDSYQLPEEPEVLAAPATEQDVTKPQQPATEQPQQPATAAPQQPATAAPQQPVAPPVDDTGIYFDDDFMPGNNNQPNTQPQNFDIEDEYYELEGF